MDSNVVAAYAGVVAVIVGVIAIVVTWIIAKRQEELQRAEARKQNIRDTCDNLSSLLTHWHDALTDAVKQDDLKKIEDVGDNADSIKASLKNFKLQLEQFQKYRTYQGPLEEIEPSLRELPGFGEVIKRLDDFESTALDFKDGISGTLKDRIRDGSTKYTDLKEYEKLQDQSLKIVSEAYDAAISEIARLRKSTLRA